MKPPSFEMKARDDRRKEIFWQIIYLIAGASGSAFKSPNSSFSPANFSMYFQISTTVLENKVTTVTKTQVRSSSLSGELTHDWVQHLVTFLEKWRSGTDVTRTNESER